MSAYRWWTVTAWHSAGDSGLKLGPISIYRYVWRDGCGMNRWYEGRGMQWGVCILNRAFYDSGIALMRRGQ